MAIKHTDRHEEKLESDMKKLGIGDRRETFSEQEGEKSETGAKEKRRKD